MSQRAVAFPVEDGTMLSGVVHGPVGEAGAGVVMAHGFSGVKEQINHYARRFADAGLAVLVFDHRGFGESEGTPRQEVTASRQLADWRDALTFAGDQPEFPAGRRLGVWGSSFAGGLAMVLGATDSRVGCVVAQVPHVSGHRNGARMFSVGQREQLARAFVADRSGRASGAQPITLPVFGSRADEPVALPPLMSPQFVAAAHDGAPTWRNYVTLRSVEDMLSFEPAGWVPYISPTPLLMIVGENDTCTFFEVQVEVYAEAREPKRLVVHPGGHFDTYAEHFQLTADAAAEWFTDHLTATRDLSRHRHSAAALHTSPQIG